MSRSPTDAPDGRLRARPSTERSGPTGRGCWCRRATRPSCAMLAAAGRRPRCRCRVVRRGRWRGSAGLGPLEPLLADPTVTEVMVNGGGAVWVERVGALARTALDLDERRRARTSSSGSSAPLGLRVDRVPARWSTPGSPTARGSTPSCRPLAVDGPCLTIRRFAATAHPARRRSARRRSPRCCGGRSAHARNVVVSGGTGAGKTTLPQRASPRASPPASASSPSRTPPSSACPAQPRRAPRGPAGQRRRRRRGDASATWSATPCGCDPIASSSARSAAPRRSTCCRR